MPVLKVKNNGEWQDTFGISSHTHTINDITDFPASLPGSGGDADTLDGKHADEFALASDIEVIQHKIGDTPVSEQITSAIPTLLPNPHPITINGAVYNGSEAVKLDTKAFVVTVSADAGGYTANKTVEELDNAYNAGRQIYCEWEAFLPLISTYGSTTSSSRGYTFGGVIYGREHYVNIGTNGVNVSSNTLAYLYQINNAVEQKSQVQIITWEDDD